MQEARQQQINNPEFLYLQAAEILPEVYVDINHPCFPGLLLDNSRERAQ
jgi:hypothetical protein